MDESKGKLLTEYEIPPEETKRLIIQQRLIKTLNDNSKVLRTDILYENDCISLWLRPGLKFTRGTHGFIQIPLTVARVREELENVQWCFCHSCRGALINFTMGVTDAYGHKYGRYAWSSNARPQTYHVSEPDPFGHFKRYAEKVMEWSSK